MAIWKRASIAALSAGLGSLGLAAASPAGGDLAASGGTLRIGAGDIGFLDPTFPSDLRFSTTQLRLFGYPDREGRRSNRLIPEAAEGQPRISRDRKTYTFTIRKGLRFSDGKPVAAANFAFGLARALRPEFGSPAAGNGLDNIVGAGSVIEGRAESLTGVRARGRTLTVTVKRPQSDLLTLLAGEPALSLSLPPTVPITKAPVPSAGPYYVKEWEPEKRVLLVRNPYWSRRAIPWRPARLDAIEWTLGLSSEESVRLVERGDLDLTEDFPPSEVVVLAKRYGVNKERLFVRPASRVWYLVFNSGRPLFRGNARLRRAVNFAIDRPELTRQFTALPLKRTDQILPPIVPGYKNADVYPLRGANVTEGRRLARGSLRGGKVVMYNRTGQLGTLLAQVIRFNLGKIGLDVDVKTFDPPVMFERMNTRGEPWDISVFGSNGNLDPASWIDCYHRREIRFEGGRNQGCNIFLFDEPAWNRRIDEASRLTGEARYAAFGQLDRDLMREAAPVAPIFSGRNWAFVSAGVGCFTFRAAEVDLVALCKK